MDKDKVIEKLEANLPVTGVFAVDRYRIEWLNKCATEICSLDEWISVEDRLPEKSESNKYGQVLMYREANPSQRSLTYTIYNSDMLKHADNETYWMPLPQPPKQDKL